MSPHVRPWLDVIGLCVYVALGVVASFGEGGALGFGAGFCTALQTIWLLDGRRARKVAP